MAAWSDDNSEQHKSYMLSPLQNDAICPSQPRRQSDVKLDEDDSNSKDLPKEQKKDIEKNSKSPKGKEKGKKT